MEYIYVFLFLSFFFKYLIILHVVTIRCKHIYELFLHLHQLHVYDENKALLASSFTALKLNVKPYRAEARSYSLLHFVKNIHHKDVQR